MGKLVVVKSGPESDEKVVGNVWFVSACFKNDGVTWQKWMVSKIDGLPGKMDGFRSGPQTHEKCCENWWFSKMVQQVMKSGEKVWFVSACFKTDGAPWQKWMVSKIDGLPWQNGWFQKWSTDT